jgi:hypothetical protein
MIIDSFENSIITTKSDFALLPFTLKVSHLFSSNFLLKFYLKAIDADNRKAKIIDF